MSLGYPLSVLITTLLSFFPFFLLFFSLLFFLLVFSPFQIGSAQSEFSEIFWEPAGLAVDWPRLAFQSLSLSVKAEPVKSNSRLDLSSLTTNPVKCTSFNLTKIWKKNVFWENLYGLWLNASDARMLRGYSPSACSTPRYSLITPITDLCLSIRVSIFQHVGW